MYRGGLGKLYHSRLPAGRAVSEVVELWGCGEGLIAQETYPSPQLLLGHRRRIREGQTINVTNGSPLLTEDLQLLHFLTPTPCTDVIRPYEERVVLYAHISSRTNCRIYISSASHFRSSGSYRGNAVMMMTVPLDCATSISGKIHTNMVCIYSMQEVSVWFKFENIL